MTKYGGKKLTGKHPLAYMGVEPISPPEMISYSRSPTAADYKGHNVGTIWFTTNPVTRIASEIWMLVGLSPLGTATWKQLYPGAAGELTVTTDLATPSISAALVIQLLGQAGIISTTGSGGANNIVTIGMPNGTMDGGVLISSNGGAPVWNTLTAGNAIDIAQAPGTITISSTLKVYGNGGLTWAEPNAAGRINIIGALGTTVVGDNVNTITITAGGGGGGSVTSVNPGTNINITSLSDPAIDPVVNLNSSIQQPVTNAAGTQGVYSLGSTALPGGYITDRFLHAYGTDNLFLGSHAGNFTLTAINSVGVGKESLLNLTSGNNNCCLGNQSLKLIQSGVGHCAFGDSSLQSVLGNYNIAIGDQSGLGYVGVESSNILLSSFGTVGDNNTIRIGTPGTGAGQQDKAYIAGIYQKTMGATKEIAFIDSNHKLGSVAVLPIAYGGTNATTMAADSGVIYYETASTSLKSTTTGASGLFLKSNGAGAAPSWAAAGGTGTVTGVTGILPIQVAPTTPNPVVSLSQGTNGQVLIAKNAAAAIWANITPGVGITIGEAANAITITNKVTYQTDDGAGFLVAPDTVTGVVKILGGAAIKTHYTAADTITIDDTLDINLQAASYVLVITDAGKFVQINNGAANTLTVPLNAAVPFVVGTQIVVQQYGAGQTSVVAAGGVTIRSAGGRLKLAEQYSMAALVKTALPDEWQLGGDITL